MEEYLELYEERAAIMQFDGGLSKDDAEIKAKDDILELYKQRGGKEHDNLLFLLRGRIFRRVR